jgi:hypothetical protein
VSRPKLAVHGHFYQPDRRDPFSGQTAPQPAAAPYRDWNARIDAECYKPNVERGNLRHISFDLGPTLATWLAEHDPATHDGFVAADLPGVKADPQSGAADPQAGNALAQPYHHTILPLASLADRRTEIRWGVRDFELRFGRRPAGLWLPETAVDLPTLRLLAEAQIRYTILAPWQSADPRLDTRWPYRVELGGGQAIVVVFFDGPISATAAFDAGATVNADSFAHDHILPRLAGASFADGGEPLILMATDGELYGHHQKFRDLFLARLVQPGADAPDCGFDVTTVGQVVGQTPIGSLPAAHIVERTSWSCHHGVLRWSGECPDAADGRWKGPLRAAMDRLAAAIDTVVERVVGEFAEPGAVWRARDDYVDVLYGAEATAEFARQRLPKATARQRATFLTALEAERWRLAMFASDGWFWGDPIRPETKQILLCAARAARLVDGVAGTDLEARFVEDLSLFTSPSRRIAGAAIYAEALAEVGQPVR